MITNVGRAIGIAFSYRRPWRRWLLLLRVIIDRQGRAAVNSAAFAKLQGQLEGMLPEYPELVPRYLNQLRRVLPAGKVRALAEELQAEHNDDAVWLTFLVNFWYGWGDYRRGDEALELAKEIDPDYLPIYLEEAANQRVRRNHSRERSAIQRILELSQESKQRSAALVQLGYLEYSKRDFEAAAQAFSEAELDGASASGMLAAAESFRRVGREEARKRALNTYWRGRKKPSVAPELVLADAYSTMVDIEAAEYYISKAPASSDLDGSRDWAELRVAFLQGEWETASFIADRYLKRDSGAPLSRIKDIALLLEHLGDFHRAAELLLDAEQRGLSDPDSLYRAGINLGQQGRTQQAVDVLLRSRQLNSKSLKGEPNFSAVTQASSKHLREWSIEDLRRALRGVSTHRALTYVSHTLGSRYAQNGEYELAFEALRLVSSKRGATLPYFGARRSQPHPRWHETFAETIELFPVEQDLVVYESFHGGATSCNPLALCLHALGEPSLSHLQHVWIVNSNAEIDERLRADSRVTFVLRSSANAARMLATAGTVINNTSFEAAYYRREGQRYLNTWHGIPWKHLGKRVAGDPFSYGNIARNMLQATHIIAPDSHTLEALTRDQNVDRLLSPAVTQVTGYPRIDLTVSFSEARKDQLRRELGLSRDTPVVLYAPTWRGSVSDESFDLSMTLAAVRTMQQSGAQVIMRAHHFVEAELRRNEEFGDVALVPASVNSNELLSITDVLVSDFSSIIFDFGVLERPVIKYIPDYESYREERGLYFSHSEILGRSCFSLESLREALNDALETPERFEERTAKQKSFYAQEDGSASQRVWEFVQQDDIKEDGPPRDEVRPLISVSGLNANGITRALKNMVTSFRAEPVEPYLLLTRDIMENGTSDAVEALQEFSHVLLAVGQHAGTRLEVEVLRQALEGKVPLHQNLIDVLRGSEQREARRLFGTAEFDIAIEFDGYSPAKSVFIGMQKPQLAPRNAQFLHSAMVRERDIKYPWLDSSFKFYDQFDFLVSVSEGVREDNENMLFEEYGVPRDRHRVIENLIDPTRIAELGQVELTDAEDAWLTRPGLHVTAVGRLAPEKNQEAIIRALAENRDTLGAVQVALVGEGPMASDLKRLVSDLGVESQVEFFGHLSNPYPLMKASDLVIMASVHEGQGLVLLEALTLQTPIAASKIPALLPVVGQDRLGIGFHPDAEGVAGALHRVLMEGTPVRELARFNPVSYESEVNKKYRALFSER
ncbi:CDP-glycerol glycerophosphotransferase family protein [Leucobacter chromiireducens]|uniref:CDP-glycerol glycerophosphotransferase family protein n=1 Tax=Leucobacter chromiireducens TaxID=283877 RepID=UPI003F7D2B04